MSGRGSRRGIANEHWEPASFEWYTPPWIFERLGLRFDLDVASPGAEVVPWVPADRHYTLREDGLAQPWFGRVWCNPPYGDQVPRFIGRLSEHGNGLALVLARTDTRWFHAALETAAATCFLRGRLDHVPGAGATPSRPAVGSVMFAWGATCADALEASELGSVVTTARTWRAAALTLL